MYREPPGSADTHARDEHRKCTPNSLVRAQCIYDLHGRMRTMVITQEFKKALIEEINIDAVFGFELFKAIMESAGDHLVTTTYLDQALARQSKEFDKKLTRQSKEFNEKLTHF